jgi:uncharacterized membrane protein YidH (DUF202 family)
VTAPLPRDPGVQPERTLLAWRRTALALVVVAALATRYLAVELGVGAAAFGAFGILLATIALVSAQLRFRRVQRSFADADARAAPLPTAGRTLAFTALAALAVGIGAFVLVIGRM